MRIDDMKPGPELDRTLDTLMHGHEYTSLPAGLMYHNGSKWMMAPPYSTTWGGMGLVVGEMQRRGWDYRIESYKWETSFVFMQREHGGYSEQVGTDIPYLCVLAAIGALQGEDTQP